MANVIDVSYEQTGKSTKVNAMGMREMQERAYMARDSNKFLLSLFTESLLYAAIWQH